MRLRSLLVASISLLVPAIAGANNEDIARKLASYEAESQQLGQNLPQPNVGNASPRRLVDAEVAYSLGDYDNAALMLFDIVGGNPSTASGPEAEQAIFYLADSLYEKGDRGAAHGYFALLANNPSGRYYTKALERLVELAIAQNDPSGVDDYLAKLGSSPYIHGKWLFAQRKYDEAIGFFTQVGPGEHELQAQYYIGAAAVAKSDLARATEIYTALVDRKPKSSSDRRVIELAQLALGRVYYEREQPAKSIDAYLLVDRHSDLFPDALYEVSWVYVKSKQYDKALKALELLEQQMPQSTRNATMRILEGNLRIRKAQLLRTAQINGTINVNEKDDPASEYDKADQIFADTHTQYAPAYDSLSRVIVGTTDPAQLVDQVSGRNTHVFQVVAPIPDAAAQLLREEPAVQRVLAVESDLADIQTNIDQTEAMIARLEGVLAAGAKANPYPQLAARRARLAAIADDIIKVRADLADEQIALVGSPGDLGRLTANRKQAMQSLAALQTAEQQSGARQVQDNASYDRIDDAATEVEGVIGSAQGMAVALRKYSDDGKVPDDQRAALKEQLDTIGKEAVAIEDELAQIRREAGVGRDLAKVVDESIVQARQGRAAVKAAEDEEARALAGFAASARDAKKAQELARLDDRAARVAEQLAAVDTQIDGMVAQGLDQVRATIASARKDLDDYKHELADLSAESRQSGGTIIAASFKDVQAKLYDIVIRSDVGTVDVAWSQKEDTDDDLKRLTLSRARELKQLKDEFRDVLEQAVPAPQPKKKAVAPIDDQPPKNAGSPDQGGGGNRVSPGDNGGKGGGTQQTVKPDEQKQQKKQPPQKTQPKKGGGK